MAFDTRLRTICFSRSGSAHADPATSVQDRSELGIVHFRYLDDPLDDRPQLGLHRRERDHPDLGPGSDEEILDHVRQFTALLGDVADQFSRRSGSSVFGLVDAAFRRWRRPS